MGTLDRMFTRALRGSGGGLGNALPGTGYTASARDRNAGSTNPGAGRGNRRNPVAATRSITYNSPGQPLPLDIASDELSQENYLGSVYVMRCVRLIAETLAESPFVVGPDPFDPGTFTLDAPMARLLGPATPQAPGGPNPHLSARAFWIWTVIQYITSGRWGWELQWDGTPERSPLIGLWPLISIALAPIPIDGKTDLWAGFQYQTPTGFVQMTPQRVMYAWRPSISDWRMPESVLQSARLPIFMHRALDRYMVNLLKNNMVATTMVVAPPFDEADQRRSWEDQFLAEFTGVDRTGGTIFGYVEADEDDPSGKPLVQVERIAQTGTEASLIELSRDAKNDITIALGVPRSLIGDASQRTYANASSEYKNFWTITMLNMIAEIQDHVNLRLAPLIDPSMVGWFDLSKVVALQPEAIFMPPDVAEAINMGILDATQAADILGIPPPGDQGDSDVETALIGEEATNPKSGGGSGRAAVVNMRLRQWGFRDDVPRQEWVQVARTVPMNAQLYREPAKRVRHHLERPKIRAFGPHDGFRQAELVMERTAGLRALAVAKQKTAVVKRYLAENYPKDTLDWVDEADWEGPKRIPLDDIDMDRRPGGRDQGKVEGIARAIADGDDDASAPVVLVRTPDGSHKVADGYHRTLARKRLGQTTAPAYVGTVEDGEGPWDEEMHRRKRNRAALAPHRPTLALPPGNVRAMDQWYGIGSYTQPSPPRTVDVKELLEERHPYVVESYDRFNGVPNHVVEAVAEALSEADTQDEDEGPVKGVKGKMASTQVARPVASSY